MAGVRTMARGATRPAGRGRLVAAAGFLLAALGAPPAHAAPALAVSPPAAPPGAAVVVEGTEFGGCAEPDTGDTHVEVLFDGAHLTDRVQPGGYGTFRAPATVPANAEPGKHVVAARCVYGFSTPGPTMASVEFHVLLPPPGRPAATTPPGRTASPSPARAAPSRSPRPAVAPPPPAPATATATPSRTGTTTHPAPPVTTPPTAPTGLPAAAVAAPPGPPTSARAWLPAALPRRIDTRPVAFAQSLGLACLLALLVGFPAELFNSTVHDNGDRIRRALARLPRPPEARVPMPAQVAAFTVVAAGLTALAEPALGWNRTTFVTVAGLLVAIPVTLLAFEVPVELWCRRCAGAAAALKVLPFALCFAALLALLSRVVGFQPGYVYGLVAGYAVLAGRRLSDDQQGRGVLLGTLSLLLVSALAWAAWVAAGPPVAGAFGAEVFDGVLATVVFLGVEGLVFALVPLRFLDGEALWRWNRAWWTVAYVAAAFVFVHVLLTSRDEVSGAAIGRMLALFVGLGLASVAFWAWFRLRPEPR